MDTEAVARELHALKGQRYRAMLEGDVDTLERLLGDGLVYTHSTGTADTKATYLAGVQAKTLTYQSIERLQEHIQVYGGTGVVTGRARVDVLVDGVPRLAHLRYLGVWVQGAKGWRMVAFQATPQPA